MVHCTDIAGRNRGQAKLGHDRMCCPALNDTVLENELPAQPTGSAAVSLRWQFAVHPELLTL
jgi:hypothetical protein